MCDCSIHMTVATNWSCTDMPSERDVPHDVRVRTLSKQGKLNSVTRQSSKEGKKAACHFSKNNICQRAHMREEQTDGLPRERETTCSCVAGCLSAHGCHKSILPPLLLCVFINFHLDISGLKCIRGPLHSGDSMGFIKNEWGRPLKPFTETLERDWWYFHPVLRLGMENGDYLRKLVWTRSVVFTFVTHVWQN